MFNLKQFFMQKKNLFGIALLCASVFLFTGCDQIVSSLDNPVNSYLQITEAPKGMLEPGQTFELKATSINSDKAIVYESLTPEVATVDAQTGVLTAVDEGKAKIKVSVEKSDYYNADDSILIVTVQYPDIKAPLTLEAKEDGKITVNVKKDKNFDDVTATKIDSEYKKTTTTISKNTTNEDIIVEIPVKAGEFVRFESKNKGFDEAINIRVSDSCYVYGNIMSIVNDSEDGDFTKDVELAGSLKSLFNTARRLTNHPTRNIVLPATKLYGNCYFSLFKNCAITRAPELPAETVKNGVYRQMFMGCTKLAKAPKLIAEDLTSCTNCYQEMFSGCILLASAPELPATKLANNCYQKTFFGCTALTKAPELKADQVYGYSYAEMFSGCVQLVNAPKLPATKLKSNCYRQMFQNCTALTKAPDLNVANLVDGSSAISNCYREMFKGCTNLKAVKCLATTNITGNNVTDWLSGVSGTGIFTRAAGATWNSGASGIPVGWTVISE